VLFVVVDWGFLVGIGFVFVVFEVVLWVFVW